MTDEKTIRLFAAIEPPPEVLTELERLQFRLRKLIHGSVRWVRPEGIHLTVKFFGDVPESRLEEIKNRLKQCADQSLPMNFRAADLGAFPNLDRPRVIWIGIGGDVGPLAKLQKQVDDAFLPLGFAKEERPFRPHLTLARVKVPRMLVGLVEAMEKGGPYEAGSFTARELGLIKSDLTPQGAIYTKLAGLTFPTNL